MTERDKPNPDHVRRDFYHLALDWVYLHTHLSKPVATDNGRRSTYREYGHPAQWASDTKREIAALFHSWHELLAEARGETAPPPPESAEQVRVVKAWLYLEPRFHQLVATVTEATAFKEISDLHHRIRQALGFDARPKHALNAPCPQCKMKGTMMRTAAPDSHIDCEACGLMISESDYPKLVRSILDEMTEPLA